MNRSIYPKPFRPPAGRFFLLAALSLVFFSLVSPLFAYRILFYYNRFDGTQGGFLHCVTALRDAGHEVKVVDVAGVNPDPRAEDWGAFDQVWDMRFVDENKESCGSGDKHAADYFDGRWRERAEDYLAHCGKMLVAGENYQLTDRNEGIYAFLQKVGAVREGFDSCPPSRRGNSITEDPSSYPVLNDLGPVSFWGAFVGGIPLDELTGTSFVQTRVGWQNNDGVDRSIASGWESSQLRVGEENCSRGRLFVVWDATMWSLWKLPISSPEERWETEQAKKTTIYFFPAAAKWLGGWDCPCGSRLAPTTIPPVSEKTKSVLNTQSGTLPPSGTARMFEINQSTLSASPAAPPVSQTRSTPVTLVFSRPPVNIFIRFADGAGRYQLAVEDGQGRLLEMIWDSPMTTGGEAWASWDGKTSLGTLAGPGRYPAVLFKNGKALRSILLQWLPGN
jgi:hypothetical protein